ncbi:MAG: ABC transporter permease [Deltaproteobacteria bacterium]|nr:ABC transporter permease [Deltaproteobacteria bacterium]
MVDLYGFGGALAAGAWVTIKLALASLIFGLCLGLIGAGAKLSRFFLLRTAADIGTTIVRGVPELVLVLAVYFGGAVVINGLAAKIGYSGYIEINAFGAGVLAIGAAFGAYATEVFRGAILAIPKGQVEAARALGMPAFLLFRRIVLPQVWRYALPGLGNLFLILQKNTALVSVTGLSDLMRNTTVAVGFTRKPFTFYLVAALIYLGFTTITMVGNQFLERWASRGVREA